ncbi:MAG: hypothetical protein KIT08_01470 [Anaerolineales bacterium]|nr:MAG: hypothetical protein KIT08_01470 [Anaerolineales bacterium]
MTDVTSTREVLFPNVRQWLEHTGFAVPVAAFGPDMHGLDHHAVVVDMSKAYDERNEHAESTIVDSVSEWKAKFDYPHPVVVEFRYINWSGKTE